MINLTGPKGVHRISDNSSAIPGISQRCNSKVVTYSTEELPGSQLVDTKMPNERRALVGMNMNSTVVNYASSSIP